MNATCVNGLLCSRMSRGGERKKGGKCLRPKCCCLTATCGRYLLHVVPSCMCPFLFRLLTQRVARVEDGPSKNGGPPLPRLEYTSGTDDGIDPTTSDHSALTWSVVVR